jgi:hypothetical protein
MRSYRMKRRSKRGGDVRELVPTVSAREFVLAWQTSATVAEVAKKVGRSKNACRVRAFRYREWYDIPLKVHDPVVIEPIDWSELEEYARELGKELKPSVLTSAHSLDSGTG